MIARGEGAAPAPPPRVGSWARAGSLIGIVVAVEEGLVTLFAPADRQVARVAVGASEALPVGAVTVTLAFDLPVPHGVGEEPLRRWLAMLTDPVLRETARSALEDQRLDAGATLPQVRVAVAPMAGAAALCLCGAATPTPEGLPVPCAECGRDAVPPPASG